MSLLIPAAKDMRASLGYEAPVSFRQALAEIDRTEDVIFSEDGTRLAIAAFLLNRIYVFSTKIESGSDGTGPDISLWEVVVMASHQLKHPHGMVFLGNDHLMVSNRSGEVTLFKIPELGDSRKTVFVEPVGIIPSRPWYKAKVQTPGSITVYPLGENQFRVFINNDNWQFISHHTVTLGPSVGIRHHGVLIENGLALPDGLAISPDKLWIGVSNHITGEVLLFKNTSQLNRKTAATARLQGIVCPHGIDFDSEGNLFAADAASPYVHVFKRPADGWNGDHRPSSRIRFVDRETFYRGRYDCYEGGLKGLHIHRPHNLLVTTFKFGILDFRSIASIRDRSDPVDEEELENLFAGRRKYAAKSTVAHSRKWTTWGRTRHILGVLKLSWLKHPQKKALRARLNLLNQQNLTSEESLLNANGPVVSMATHPGRIQTTYLAIESIARGTLKPGRMILWVSGAPETPDTLKRLENRGLEIRPTEDYGPHTKYFPFVRELSDLDSLPSAAVTADDDRFYPESWLEKLVNFHQTNPTCIHGFHLPRMEFNRFHFEPYEDWESLDSGEPDRLNFIHSSFGMIYPPAFLQVVAKEGEGFQKIKVSSDNTWLSYIAFKHGVKICSHKIDDPIEQLPGTEKTGQSNTSTSHGSIQLQLAKVFNADDRRTLMEIQKRRCQTS